MNKLKILLVIICSAGLLFIISCKNGTGDKGTANKPANELNADKKYQYSVHLSKGEKYYYTLKTGIRTTLEVNNKEIETDNQSEIGMVYDVIKDSGGIFVLKLTYNKIHLELKKSDTEDQVLDAENAASSFDQMDKLLADIKGSSIIITLDSKGNILNVTGSKEISDKIMASMAMENLETKRKVQELVSRVAGESFIVENLKAGFRILPDSALETGASWNKRSRQPGDFKVDVHSEYSLTSLKDSIAKVTINGKVENGKNNVIKYMGYDVTTDLNGDQEGFLKIDMTTGLLNYSYSITSVKGSIQVLGKNVPIKFKVKKEITSRKM